MIPTPNTPFPLENFLASAVEALKVQGDARALGATGANHRLR